MDTSKEYILMCEKAKEIQKLRPNPIEYTRGIDGINVVLYDYEGNLWFNRDGEDLLWLPRQDQLQEMLLADPENRFNTSICYITLVCNFAKFCGIFDEDEEGRSNIDLRKESLEVLWLAFVMKEKHKKTWDGEKWIKKA